MSKSPLHQVNADFGGKDKLVDKIVGLLGSGEEPRDELRKRLLGAANSKLIRLHRVASTVKDKFGSKDKLVDATATQLGKTRDKDYVEKLGSFSSGKLLDLLRAGVKRGVPPVKAAAVPASSAAGAEPAAKAPAAAPKAKAKVKAAPRSEKTEKHEKAGAKPAAKAAAKHGSSVAKHATSAAKHGSSAAKKKK